MVESDGAHGVICDTLRQLSDEGKLRVSELANAACISPGAIYKWIAAEREPTFTNLQRMFKAASREAQAEILACFTRGTNWQHSVVDVELDVNGDGKIDLIDAARTNADGGRSQAHAVCALINMLSVEKVSIDLLRSVRNQASQAAGLMQQTARIIDVVIERQGQRRKCQPLPGGGA